MGFLSNYKFVIGHQTSQIQFVDRQFNVKYARWGIASLVALLRFYMYCNSCLIYTTFCAFVVVSDSLGSPLKPRFLFNLSSPTGGV